MSQKAMIVPIIRKKGLSIDDFRAYWRAVHGPIAARLTGVGFYEQIHLDHSEHTFGKGDDTYGAEQLDGIAILGFHSQVQLDAYRGVASVMQNDEANVFSFAARYEIAPEIAPDIVSESGAPASKHLPSAPVWPPIIQNRQGQIVVLQRHGNVQDDAAQIQFRNEVSGLIARYNAEMNTTDVWVHFVEPRETSVAPDANIDRFTPGERQFQALIRLGDEKGARFASLISQLTRLESVKFGRVCQIAASYLFVIDDKITLFALRGGEAEDLITRLGATNQRSLGISKLFAPDERLGDQSVE